MSCDDATGGFTIQFVAPFLGNAPPPNNRSIVKATGTTSGYVARNAFAVIPEITPTPTVTDTPTATPTLEPAAITLIPAEGPAYTLVTVTGVGFLPGEIVTITWYGDGGEIGPPLGAVTATVNTNSGFMARYNAPYLHDAPPPYNRSIVKATGATSGIVARNAFIVTPRDTPTPIPTRIATRTHTPTPTPKSSATLALDPTHGPPYSRVVATGAGFASHEAVKVTWAEKGAPPFATLDAVADATGSFTVTYMIFIIGSPLASHNIEVQATGQTSGRTARQLFLLEPIFGVPTSTPSPTPTPTSTPIAAPHTIYRHTYQGDAKAAGKRHGSD